MALGGVFDADSGGVQVMMEESLAGQQAEERGRVASKDIARWEKRAKRRAGHLNVLPSVAHRRR